MTRATIRWLASPRDFVAFAYRARAILRRVQGDQAAWLVSVTLLGAGLLIVHVMLLIRTARSELSKLWRALAWLPPLTPVAGWMAGQRVLTGLWLVGALAYGMLRAAGP